MNTVVQYPIAWSGSDIYYASGTTIEGINLFRATIDPATWTIKGPAEPITTGPGMKVFASVTRDGRIIIGDMTVAMHAWSVVAHPDTGEVSGTPQRLARDLMQNFYPTVSRDGGKAAFTAFGGAALARIGIRVVDLRSGRDISIPVRAVGLSQFPRLSPDGSLLAYRDVVEGKLLTFVLAPGRSTAGRSAPLHRARVLSRQPVRHREGPGERAREAGPRVRRADPRAHNRAGRHQGRELSTDGAWIAWLVATPAGTAAIRVGPVGPMADGASRTVTIAEDDHYLGAPAWSPNDRWLYYLSEAGDRCALVARELDPATKALSAASAESRSASTTG